MGWIIGFEPMVSSATNWRFNQLSYTHHILRRIFQTTNQIIIWITAFVKRKIKKYQILSCNGAH